MGHENEDRNNLDYDAALELCRQSMDASIQLLTNQQLSRTLLEVVRGNHPNLGDQLAKSFIAGLYEELDNRSLSTDSDP